MGFGWLGISYFVFLCLEFILFFILCGVRLVSGSFLIMEGLRIDLGNVLFYKRFRDFLFKIFGKRLGKGFVDFCVFFIVLCCFEIFRLIRNNR